MDGANCGPRELGKARGIGQDTPRPPSRLGYRILYTHESAFRRLHKRVRKQLVAEKDREALGRLAYQRLWEQPVRKQQPRGQEFLGRIPKQE